jgi:hypothetical protein
VANAQWGLRHQKPSERGVRAGQQAAGHWQQQCSRVWIADGSQGLPHMGSECVSSVATLPAAQNIAQPRKLMLLGVPRPGMLPVSGMYWPRRSDTNTRPSPLEDACNISTNLGVGPPRAIRGRRFEVPDPEQTRVGSGGGGAPTVLSSPSSYRQIWMHHNPTPALVAITVCGPYLGTVPISGLRVCSRVAVLGTRPRDAAGGGSPLRGMFPDSTSP